MNLSKQHFPILNLPASDQDSNIGSPKGTKEYITPSTETEELNKFKIENANYHSLIEV